MITISQIPSTYKIPIMTGKSLDEFLDIGELEAIAERMGVNGSVAYAKFMDTVYQTVYAPDLLDRAYSAVRSKQCDHSDWDLQMDNSGRTWSVCNLCGVEGD